VTISFSRLALLHGVSQSVSQSVNNCSTYTPAVSSVRSEFQLFISSLEMSLLINAAKLIPVPVIRTRTRRGLI